MYIFGNAMIPNEALHSLSNRPSTASPTQFTNTKNIHILLTCAKWIQLGFSNCRMDLLYATVRR